MKKKATKSLKIGDRTFDEILLTKEQVEQEVLKWQNILGLREWSVLVQFRTKATMSLPDSQGTIGVAPTKNLAELEVMEASEYGTRLVPQDMEKTVVHELLHLLLRPLKLKKKGHREEEILIEKLSSALIGVARGHFA